MMKKYIYFLFLPFILLLSNCDTNDDGFYNNKIVNISQELVTFSSSTTYNVGDYFTVNADFSRYLNELGQTTPLDIFTTTGGATKYAFSYVIEKKISDSEWETVSVDDSLLMISKGEAANGIYVYGICSYNAADQTYEYNVGFPLLSTGNYRVSFGYNSDEKDIIELRSVSRSEQIILNLNTEGNQFDVNGYFYFNVLP